MKPGVEADPHRRHERLADRQRQQLAVLRRQLVREQPDQAAVEDVGDDEADDQRAEADEEPLAQLFEVLDERCLFAVFQATRQARIGR